MEQLLLIKEKLKKFVGKNDALVIPGLKFLLTLVALMQINKNLGYMGRLASAPITLIIALGASFLPVNLTIIILALVITAHVYALSFEAAIVVLALFLILFLLYFRFASKDSYAAIITPVLFGLHIPYVMPVSMGLVGTLSSVVSVSCGTVIYYVLAFISNNAEDLKKVGADGSKIAAFKDIIDGIVSNKEMFVVTMAFAMTVIIVYMIRRLSIDYSWFVAIGAGSVACFFVVLVGNIATSAGINMGLAFLGTIISIILNIILQFFCFNLDYNRTEKVQFEDDEYYYYVKAVPKNTVKERNQVTKRNNVVVNDYDEIVTKRRTEEAAPVRRPATDARQTVQRRATEAARSERSANVNKGPFGLSGGRPAGEGRRNDQNR